MKNSPYLVDAEEFSEPFNFKDIILKYLRYWKWFLFAFLFFLAVAFLYARYATEIYYSYAKIKIIDDSKDLDIATDPLKLLSGKPSINLDNEIEVIESYRLLSDVVKELKLDVTYYEYGSIKKSETWDAPFIVTKNIAEDSIKKPIKFEVYLKDKTITVIDSENKETELLINENGMSEDTELPFVVQLKKNLKRDYSDIKFDVYITTVKKAVSDLKEKFIVSATSEGSEILELSLQAENLDKSEAILNEIIRKFDLDGIEDRRLVSQRTIDFIDERFINLSIELDSIEVGKENFKTDNDLSYIEADAGATIQKKEITESEVANLETQVVLTQLIKDDLAKASVYNLLPNNLGLESTGVNSLVNAYNELITERERLLISVGENHPALQAINKQIRSTKTNIDRAINGYEQQLSVSLNRLNQERYRAGSIFSKLPEKEKILRSIERQQLIKENLYLLLLQKREEAAIKYAVTAPSVKVVDYGITKVDPIKPKRIIIYPFALLLSFLLPFVILYIKFVMDTKIHDRTDIEKINPNIPVVAEIPFLEDKKSFLDTTDRSILAESFRILSTNINYLLPKKENGLGQIIFTTSTIKGEGKSLIAFNLSLAYASLKKKVLLVGADLRNPQLHIFFDVNKDITGLVDYLYDTDKEFKDCIQNGIGNNSNYEVCFSGRIPPNAPELLSSSRFEQFLLEATKSYDYIIVDTAPTILVADTLLISKHADLTIYVARANYTEKRLLEFSNELNRSKKIKNMAYVVNEVGLGKAKDYNYGYGYGYSSTDK